MVEGVGGPMVPLSRDYLVRDLAAELRLPVIVVARPGLGTISHTLLATEALRSVGLTLAGVVLTPWPPRPSVIEQSNRETIERLAATRVATVPPTRLDSLSSAGADRSLQELLAPLREGSGELSAA